MLIDSAKDSLSFSVTHYKRPKHAHAVQAKTVEEKKLWAHHIKRIILENHHAIIPQKAKDAILEMDSMYPPRHRSPERLRKEFQRERRQGRRQSGLNTVTLKPDTRDVLKEAEGGALSSCDSQLTVKDDLTEQSSVHELPQEVTSEPEQTENLEADSLSDADSALTLTSCRGSEEVRPEGEAALPEEPPSASPDPDSKILSSGDSSDDEEDEEDAAKSEEEAASILPSSVLDKASAIAQHFSNSFKRGSVAQDDARSLSRTGTGRSLSAEPVDRALRLNSVCSDLVAAFSATDSALLSPRGGSLFDDDRGVRRRRDSVLSKRDQLLIGKIRSYYENAESQDATFRLQRRESLTYIPTGLVRSSVSRFNSVPQDEPALPKLWTRTPSSRSDPSSVESLLTGPTDTRDHRVSTEDSAPGLRSTSQSLENAPFEEEEFRPSSEMIKIWQVMERDITVSPNVKRAREAQRNFTENPNKNPDQEASALNTDSRESKNHSSLKVNGPEATVLKTPLPLEAQLKVEAEEEPSQVDDVDATKNKVLHLARQYSQRLKPIQPVGGVLSSKKTLPCVVEETEVSEKPKLTLNLVSENKSSTIDRPPTPLLGVVSSGQASTCSLLSPPPTEGFTWPDVRELRSKYLEKKGPVGWSHSIPEQMFGDLRRHSSCSSGHFLCEGTSTEMPPQEDTSSRPLLRAKSLDPQLTRVQVTELQKLHKQDVDSSHEDFFIAAETQLPDDPQHKMIIIERLPAPESECSATAPNTQEEEDEDENDDSYVQIRSPTSREKISIMAVASRCRAYQDSDEYKLSGSVRPGELHQTEESADPQNPEEFEQKTDGGHQSMVKNLRDKFQSLS